MYARRTTLSSHGYKGPERRSIAPVERHPFSKLVQNPGAVPRVTAIRALQEMRGGSQPKLLLCSDGGYYVVKFENTPQGVRILANELLGTLLARELALPVPEFAIVDVPADLICGGGLLRIQLVHGNAPCQSGLCFGSRFPQAVLDFPTEAHLGRVENISDFAGMLVFDKWTDNRDDRQVVLVPKFNGSSDLGYRALMIDQGFCFGGPTWDLSDRSRRGLYPKKSVYSKINGICAFDSWLERLEKANRQVLEMAATQIPPEWYGHDASALAELVQTLDQRRAHVPDFLFSARRSAEHFFPAWHVPVRDNRKTSGRASPRQRRVVRQLP